MRSKLELWKIVDENFDKLFRYGLCLTLYYLCMSKRISIKEHKILESELKDYGNTKKLFLGERGDPIPRKEFIKKMIEKHQNDQHYQQQKT